jgi:DNA-binding transcriptional MocR family regulator
VAAGLRVGFVAAPTDWVPAIERIIRATTWNTPCVLTAIACGWLEDGTIAELEANKRKDAIARQSLASEVLSGLRCVSHPASYFLWLPLGDEVRADQIAMALVRQRIAVSTAEPFATSEHVPHAIRLALGSLELSALGDALEKVRKVIGNYSY